MAWTHQVHLGSIPGLRRRIFAFHAFMVFGGILLSLMFLDSVDVCMSSVDWFSRFVSKIGGLIQHILIFFNSRTYTSTTIYMDNYFICIIHNKRIQTLCFEESTGSYCFSYLDIQIFIRVTRRIVCDYFNLDPSIGGSGYKMSTAGIPEKTTFHVFQGLRGEVLISRETPTLADTYGNSVSPWLQSDTIMPCAWCCSRCGVDKKIRPEANVSTSSP